MKQSIFRIVLFLFVLTGLAVPAGSAQALPGVETLSGWLTIEWGDARDGASVVKAFLTTDAGERIQVDGALPALRALDRTRVRLEGRLDSASTRAGGESIFHVGSAFRQDGSENAAALEAVSGSNPWVSIMCKFSDYADEPKDLPYFQNMFSGSYPGLDHYWREASYNIVNVVGSTAVGWYVLPKPRSYYVYNGNLDFDRAANDCTAVADPHVNFAGMVGINLMFNYNLDGYAWGGSHYMTLDGVSKVWSMTWEPPWGYESITVMSHEMGHDFGLPHSSGSYGQTYDNRWDVMSDGWTDCDNSEDVVYGCLGQHTIAYHKDMLGWISPGEKFVASGGNETITLERLTLPQSGNYKMAQIPINGSSTNFYTVEVRQKAGYDVKLPGGGVIIHQVDTGRERPANVVDADGNSNTGDAGAMWTVGETFTDAANGISVYVESSSASGFTVTIATPTPPPPGAFNKSSPANGALASVSPTLVWGASSGVNGYEYCIDDVDNAACDASWVGAAGTSAALSGLVENTTYFWQVRALNLNGTTDANAGAWWSFTAAQVAPNSLEPGSLYPAAADNAHTRRPAFMWDAYPTATSYALEVADAAYCGTFARKALRVTTAATSYTHTRDLRANSVYCWRVRANTANGVSEYSATRTFRTGNPPYTPALSAPAKNALLTSAQQPAFNWGNSTLPRGTQFGYYELQFDTTNSFTSPVTFTTTPGDLNDSDLTPPTAGFPLLAHAATYYWRVRAWNDAGDYSGWSQAYSFRVSYEQPLLSTPTDGDAAGSLRPTFTWTAVLGATSYKIQVSVYSTFRFNAVNATVSGATAYTPSANLSANKTYYWRVQALGAFGPGAWSATWSFVTP